MERGSGFPENYTKLADFSSHFPDGREYSSRRNAIGNSFAVPVITRLLMCMLATAAGKASSHESFYPGCDLLRRPKHPHALDFIRPAAMALAEKYSSLLHDFNAFLATNGTQPWVGIDAAGAENRYK
eukprot:12415495-Karenia_brevis.AAC.1